MLTRQTFTLLLTASVALLLTSLGANAQKADQQTNWPMSAPVRMDAGQQVPAGAYGVPAFTQLKSITAQHLAGADRWRIARWAMRRIMKRKSSDLKVGATRLFYWSMQPPTTVPFSMSMVARMS